MDRSDLIDALTQSSVALRNYKRLNSGVYNFSCPLCGDSKKDKLAARGYVFTHNQSLIYKCHNCGESMSLERFIQKVSPTAWDSLNLNRFREAKAPVEEPVPVEAKNLADLNRILNTFIVPINELPVDHEAVIYLRGRKLAPEMTGDFYYVHDCRDIGFLSQSAADAFPATRAREGRILIPFRDSTGNLIGFTLRAIGESKLRYVTIKLVEDVDLIFGLDRMNPNRRIYITEGQIDSLFLPNAISCGGSRLISVTKKYPHTHKTLIFDNEPRNREIVTLIGRCIELGEQVCFFPHEYEKDLNGIVLKGQCVPELLKKLVDDHTYSGLEANLKFSQWKRI